MNKKAAELNMDKTKYANSHGLCNIDNKSCAFDLAILCEYAMGNQKFREIVSCRNYETVIICESQDPGSAKEGSKIKERKIIGDSLDIE
jgi:D-alanyl-D-alanine carboxypeptidase